MSAPMIFHFAGQKLQLFLGIILSIILGIILGIILNEIRIFYDSFLYVEDFFDNLP